MKTRTLATAAAVALFAPATQAANLSGLWLFDNPTNPAEATVGNDLIFQGTAPTFAANLADDGGNVQIGTITTAAATNANRIRADHGIAANGGGSFVNNYSIVADIFSPPGSRSSWRTLYQTNTGNSNDGDYFIRPDNDNVGVGDLTYSGSPIDETAWTRLVLTVDLTLDGGDANLYLDGALHYTHSSNPGVDGRFSLDPFLYFFTDNDGDNAPMNVAALGIYDGVLTSAEVASLGSAGDVIPEPSALLLTATAALSFLARRRR